MNAIAPYVSFVLIAVYAVEMFWRHRSSIKDGNFSWEICAGFMLLLCGFGITANLFSILRS